MLVKYYVNKKGENQISKYVNNIGNPRENIEVQAILKRIEKYGAKYLNGTKEVTTRKFKDDIFEVKFKKNRFMYLYIKNNTVYIFHAFKKKSQKTDKVNLNIINKRYKKIKKELDK